MKNFLGRFFLVAEVLVRALVVLSFFVNPFAAHAANPAADNAGSYSGGWTNGSNGGVGWQKWVLTPKTNSTTAGFSVGSSTVNGTPGIDTAGRAWGMFADLGQANTATRLASNNLPLRVGQILGVELAPGPLDVNGTNGVELLNATQEALLRVYVTGSDFGNGTFYIVDAAGTNSYTIPSYVFSGGVQVALALTNQTGGVVLLDDGNIPFSKAVALIPRGSSDIVGARLFGNSTGTGTNFFNNLLIDCGTFPSALIAAPANVCSNSPVTFFNAATGAAGFSNTWRVLDINGCGAVASPAGATNGVSLTVNPGNCSAFQVVLTVRSEGCTSVATNLFSTTAIPAPVVASSSPVCAGDTLYLTASTISNASYSWTGPNFTSSAQNPTIANAQTNNSGTYTCSIVVNGCPSTPVATTVNVFSRPTATLIGSANLCLGNSTTLTANLTGRGPWTVTYSDGSFPIVHTGVGGNGTTGTDTLVVNPLVSATYQITAVSDAGNCQALPGDISGGAVVTVNARPTAAITTPNQSICVSNSVTFDFTLTGVAPWNVTWSDGAVQSVFGSPAVRTLIFTAPGTTNFSITGVVDNNGAGCPALPIGLSGNPSVTVQPIPDATIVATPLICANSPGFAYVIPDGSMTGVKYAWVVGNGTLSTVKSNRVDFIAGSSGDLTLTVSAFTTAGCSNTVTLTTNIWSAPLIASPQSLSFRAYIINPDLTDYTTQSPTQTVRVVATNFTGNITGWSVNGTNGSDFTVSPEGPLPHHLTNGQTFAFNVVYKPSSTNSSGATLLVDTSRDNSNDCFSTLSIPLTVPATGGGKFCAQLHPLPPGPGQSYSLLTLGDVPLGFSSTSKITITNDGPSNLVLGRSNGKSISITNYSENGDCTNATQLPIFEIYPEEIEASWEGGGAGIELPPGGSISIPVSFQPCATGLSTGKYYAVVSIFGDFCDQPEGGFTNHEVKILLDGQATAPYIQIFEPTPPSGLEFPATTLGAKSAPQQVVIKNAGDGPLAGLEFAFTGTNSLDFTLVSNFCTQALDAGATCAVLVDFEPNAFGDRTGTLLVRGIATNTQPALPPRWIGVPLHGFGKIPPNSPVISVTPPSLDFGALPIASASPAKTVTVNNIGNTVLNITGVQLSGLNPGDFSVLTNACTGLQPGDSCSIGVVFTPVVATNRNAILLINSNATNGQQQVSLNGTGIALTPAVGLNPSSLNFGVVTNSSPVTRSLTITNSGNAPLTVGGLTVNGAASFTVVSNGCSSVPVGGSCTVVVQFSPINAGLQTATLQITNNAPGSPHSVPLSGTGFVLSPGVGLSASSLDFGIVTNSATITRTLTISNTGNGPLQLGAIGLSGAASFTIVTNPCANAILAPGGSCNVVLRFTPTTAGPQAATLQIPSDAANSPTNVALSGSLVLTPALCVSPNPVAFGSVSLGTTNDRTLTLRSCGYAALTVNSVQIAGASEFSLLPNSCGTLPTGEVCSVTVRFIPTGAGPRTATVTVSDNGAGSPHTVAVTGNVSASQPDLRVAIKNKDKTFKGVDLLTPPTAITNQAVVVKAKRGKARLFYVTVQNHGVYADSFFLQGADDLPGAYTVKYFLGAKKGLDITEAVKAGTFRTSTMAPGALTGQSTRIRVEVTTDVAAVAGSYPVIVTAWSASDASKSLIDSVQGTLLLKR